MSAAGRFGRICVGALLVGTLVLPFVGGYPLAYVLMLLSLLLIGCWLAAGPKLAELTDAGGMLAFAAFLLISVALVLSARKANDALYAVNFLMFALLPLLRAAVGRFATPRGIATVARLALTGTVLATLVALWQVFGNGATRAEGFGSDPIWAAQAVLIVGFLSIVGLFSGTNRWRYLYLLGPLLALLTVLLTGSRGPLLAALPLAAVALLLSPGHRRAIALTLGAVLVGGALLLALTPGGAGRVGSILVAWFEVAAGGAISEDSLSVRALLYRSSLAALLDSPLVGHGWERRLSASYSHVPGGGAAIEAIDPMMRGNHHLHADLLDLAVGAGLLGLLAYACILAAPLASALRSPRDGQRIGRLLGSAVLSVGYLGCGLSYIMFGYEFHTTLYVCLAAILLGFCRDSPLAVTKPAMAPA